jgi:arsenate reductase
MAEAFLRMCGGAEYAAFSAGTRPSAINPLSTRAMAEVGIDMSAATGYYSKGLDAFAGQRFDLVVTVCDSAAEECPFFPGGRRQEHWGFPDPSAAVGSEEERLSVFRQVRDAIGERIDIFIASAHAW